MLPRLLSSLLLGAALGLVNPLYAAKPRILVLATGGTIASAQSSSGLHASGVLNAQQLINEVPQLADLADVSGEDVVNIGSQDMTDQVWLKLARRLNDVLGQSEVDGVVITHGTDTMEETAYFLNLVMKSDKAVVMTGSMRTPGALGADGPANLFDAVEVAAHPQARGRGVMVVMNGQVHYARDVTKQNNMRLDALQSPNRGPAGLVAEGHVVLFARPIERYGLRSVFTLADAAELPRVEILYAYANMGRELIDNALQRGVKGIVIAGVGNGNMSRTAVEALAEAVTRGVAVVRSSRTISGAVARNIEVDDDALGFVASMELNPQKARVLLMLGLTKTSDPTRLQEFFYQY